MSNGKLCALWFVLLAVPLGLKAAEPPSAARVWTLRFDLDSVATVVKDRGMSPEEFVVKVTYRVGQLYGKRAYEFRPQLGGPLPKEGSVIDIGGADLLSYGKAPRLDEGDCWRDHLTGPTFGVFLLTCTEGMDTALHRRAEAMEVVNFVAVVTAHEIGHAVGLAHIYPDGLDIMTPGLWVLVGKDGKRTILQARFHKVNTVYLDWLEKQPVPTKLARNRGDNRSPRCGCQVLQSKEERK